MKKIYNSLWAESLKTLKAKIFWITIILFVFIAFMIGILIFLAKNPDLISNSDIMTAKAAMIGKADWQAFFGLLSQTIAMIGIIGFAFVFSWIFGREYTDNTIKDLLALPVSRDIIVLSKFIVASVWCIILTLSLFLAGLLIGYIISLENWSTEIAFYSFKVFSVTAFLTLLISMPLAFLASWSKGFLLPLGIMILLLIITQFLQIGAPYFAPYFPWSVPALYYISAINPYQSVQLVSYIVLVITSLAGFLSTFAWWRYADHK
jgi:ABC-2 type transport system permease protein